MSKLRNISGKECIKALSKMGFKPVRQKGSHVIMIKETPFERIGTVVPLHDELKIGTIKGILEKAKIDEEEFKKYL